MSGERAVFSTYSHVFEIDPETKKKWLPTSATAVKVAFYHDPSRRTYRIIAIESNKALVNSTITANMNFTKTSPKFGQWSDHRANTVYGLGFTSEKDLLNFIEKFNEAKSSARELLKERQQASQKLLDQDKPHSPASLGDTSPSPLSPAIRSPSVISPPATVSIGASKSPSPSLTSPPPVDISKLSASNLKADDTTGSESDEPTKRKISGSNGSSSPVLMNGDRGDISMKTNDSKLTNGHTGEHSPSTDSQVEALKLENSRLKMALATSATNVKKWDSEMQTLKNNNARLTTALEESTQHVTQWKQTLQKYKEENDQLKKKVHKLEGDREKENARADDMEAIKRENEELKEVLSAVQIDLEANVEEVGRKKFEVESMRTQLDETTTKLQVFEDENQGLLGQVSLLEDQLKMASIASRRKLTDTQQKHKEFGTKLQELLHLHRDISSHLEA